MRCNPYPTADAPRDRRGERARRRGAGAAQRVSVYRKSLRQSAGKKEVTKLLFEFISSITQVYHRNDGANAPRAYEKRSLT